MQRVLLLLIAAFLTPLQVGAQQQQFANLGDFKLESGEMIRDCRIGFRIFG